MNVEESRRNLMTTRKLDPKEVVRKGDQILLVGGSWMTANGEPHNTADEFIEVRRPLMGIQSTTAKDANQ